MEHISQEDINIEDLNNISNESMLLSPEDTDERAIGIQ